MNIVSRKLQPVVDGHDVRWREMAIYQTFAVQVGERLQNRLQQLARLVRRQRPLPNDLSENLVGELRHHVGQFHAVD